MTVKKPESFEVQSPYLTFVTRTEAAKDGLLADIQNWIQKLPQDTPPHHHVHQFYKLCDRVFKKVEAEYGRSEEDISFKSLVTGTLTTQWLLLREVAALRVAGSPYEADLQELDQEAAQYYRALFTALPEETQDLLPASPPLVSLGRSAEFFLFNNEDQMPPAIVNIPFGAVYDPPQSRGRLALAHETGHAIFDRLQPFLPELKAHIGAVRKETREPTDQQKLVHAVVLGWLSEMVADLVGTALAGPDFGYSAFSMIAGPKAYSSFTDKTHPVPVIRPYIYLEFLQYLHQQLAENDSYSEAAGLLQTHTGGIDRLAKDIEIFSEQYLTQRFEAIPAVTKVTLADIRDEMQLVVRLILDAKLEVLNGMSVGEVLIACAINMVKAPAELRTAAVSAGEKWGDQVRLDTPFVLDLSHMVPPTFAVPVTMGDWVCKFLRIC